MGGGVAIVAEIGAGQPIGEIAFFGGGRRTASVCALRDSVVLKLTQADFFELVRHEPSILQSVIRELGKRLAQTTEGQCSSDFVAPKTIAICRAGRRGLPPHFTTRLREHLAGQSDTLILDHATAVREVEGDGAFDSSAETGWFNDLERRYGRIFYTCDDEPTGWSEKALRQADQVLLVAEAEGCQPADVAANELEELAASLHEARNIRLVLSHGNRGHPDGTALWLASRPWVGMHHHVSTGGGKDLARLLRFIDGKAIGLVACGGGAFTAAHVGMYQALTEAGYEFDIMGGTSGGAAMTAAFALGVSPTDIDRLTHDMFVRRKAMGRWTWPRYSLLDHGVFDAALLEHFSDIDISDLRTGYFAVATNLSRNAPEVIRSGPLWAAVRASAAIPALLPPSYTREGDLLVDGCLIENVPLRPMQQIKTGPNVVLDLKVPRAAGRYNGEAVLPSRLRLIGGVLWPALAKSWPDGPGPHTVLMRSLMRETCDIGELLQPGDRLLSFPVPAEAGLLDWSRHSELRWAAYEFASEALAKG
jgi:NTE family protein